MRAEQSVRVGKGRQGSVRAPSRTLTVSYRLLPTLTDLFLPTLAVFFLAGFSIASLDSECEYHRYCGEDEFFHWFLIARIGFISTKIAKSRDFLLYIRRIPVIIDSQTSFAELYAGAS